MIIIIVILYFIFGIVKNIVTKILKKLDVG